MLALVVQDEGTKEMGPTGGGGQVKSLLTGWHPWLGFLHLLLPPPQLRRADKLTGPRPFLTPTSMHVRFTLWGSGSKGSQDKQALTWALARENKILPNHPQCEAWEGFCLAGWVSMCLLEASPKTGILGSTAFRGLLQGPAIPFPGNPAEWGGLRAPGLWACQSSLVATEQTQGCCP